MLRLVTTDLLVALTGSAARQKVNPFDKRVAPVFHFHAEDGLSYCKFLFFLFVVRKHIELREGVAHVIRRDPQAPDIELVVYGPVKGSEHCAGNDPSAESPGGQSN